MRRLLLLLCILSLTACAQQTNDNAFDAVALFQMGSNAVEALPLAQNDEEVVRYGGWSLNELMQSNASQKYVRFVQEDSMHEPWTNAKLAPGIYHIKKGQPVPVVILASILLANQMKNGDIDFDSDKSTLITMVDDTHCKSTPSETYVGLYWGEGMLFIDKNYCSVLGGGIWEATQ